MIENDTAQKIINICNDKYKANKSDCNKFNIAVASELNVSLLPGDYVDSMHFRISRKNGGKNGFFLAYLT